MYIIASQLTFINLLTICLLLLFEYFRRQYYGKPLRLIGKATKEVANGNFSVQIKPQRKDGRKDEFEVIYEDFNTMVGELASVEMLKQDFILNVSHELKTPLATIQAYAVSLQSDTLTRKEHDAYARKIAEASKQLSVLVSNILQMKRLENQKIMPQTKLFNLSEQICRCTLNCETIWNEKNIHMEIDLDQNIILNCDEELLDIVWNNLISNALKFTDANGIVAITAKIENEYIVVSVRDNGIGISTPAIGYIFDKFYQEDTSHATQGNGLGLALVKRIIILLNGTITVDSTLVLGSLFTVIFNKNMLYHEDTK